MHKLYDLKEMLCEELEEYGSKGKLDVGSLDVVDKLAHAIKNIDKILEFKEDGEYSSRGMSYRDGGSYARNRDGSYARRRDAMGRYSRGGNDFMMDLRELAEDAPNDHIRQKINSIMNDM